MSESQRAPRVVNPRGERVARTEGAAMTGGRMWAVVVREGGRVLVVVESREDARAIRRKAAGKKRIRDYLVCPAKVAVFPERRR